MSAHPHGPFLSWVAVAIPCAWLLAACGGSSAEASERQESGGTAAVAASDDDSLGGAGSALTFDFPPVDRDVVVKRPAAPELQPASQPASGSGTFPEIRRGGPQSGSGRVLGDASTTTGELKAEIESIVARAVQTASKATGSKANQGNCAVAVMAVDAETGDVLFRRQHKLPMIPASNMKLLTAAAALGSLGPDGSFATPFEALGQVRDGVLVGDLLVRGGGDPLYRKDGDGGIDPWLDPLAEALRKAGISRVSGALVLDEGSWLTPGPGPEWPSSSDYWMQYCALAGAFTVNGGSFRATVTPKPASGSVDVVLRPRDHGLKRRGSVKLGKKNALNVGANARGVTVKGTIPNSPNPTVAEFSAPDPVDFFGHAFVGGLGRRGIAIDGGFRRARGVDRHGAVIHTIRTPITDVLAPILEDSHNALADQLFLALGAQTQGAGTREASAQAVREGLAQIGVPADGLIQVDGSGLSKANRTNAMQLVGLVTAVIKAGGRASKTFLAALPVSGRTGSLARRMRRTPAEGRVRAKTGWVSGASGLSGVAETLEGRLVVFSILVAYPRLSGLNNKAWKPMQDDICTELVGWSPGR